jgi:type IX secretion system PorP/SprF family membrane protein
MKRLLIYILCGLIKVFDIVAQQDPQYSQYMFNYMAVNPAYAGSQEAICFTALAREQWAGMPGNPRTSIFTAQAPFKLFGANHGVGLMLMEDRLGFERNIGARLSYAYQMRLEQGKLGIGATGKFQNKALVNANWVTSSGSTNDPAIPTPTENVLGYDMALGIFFSNDNIYMGISTTNLLESRFNYEFANANFKRHYYLAAGCYLPLNNPQWEFAPSLMAYSDGRATQISVNTNFIYNKRIWGGVGYRISSVVGMVGVDIFNGIKVGYAFDYTHNNLRESFAAGGSHEIMLSYCFSLVRERAVQKYKSVRFL